MKFHKNILISFNVIERTGHCYLQGSKGVTKKIHTQELWFLRFARRPIKLNIRMKFHEDILNVFQVRDGHDFVTDGRPWQKQCLRGA